LQSLLVGPLSYQPARRDASQLLLAATPARPEKARKKVSALYDRAAAVALAAYITYDRYSAPDFSQAVTVGRF
jgi:hypothetical protein